MGVSGPPTSRLVGVLLNRRMHRGGAAAGVAGAASDSAGGRGVGGNAEPPDRAHTGLLRIHLCVLSFLAVDGFHVPYSLSMQRLKAPNRSC
jgi:hypothetical protein